MNSHFILVLILIIFALFESLMNIFLGTFTQTLILVLFFLMKVGEISLIKFSFKYKEHLESLVKIISINLLLAFIIKSQNRIIIISNSLILQCLIMQITKDNCTLYISIGTILIQLNTKSIVSIFEGEQILETIYVMIIISISIVYEFLYLKSSINILHKSPKYKQQTINDLRDYPRVMKNSS